MNDNCKVGFSTKWLKIKQKQNVFIISMCTSKQKISIIVNLSSKLINRHEWNHTRKKEVDFCITHYKTWNITKNIDQP